MDAIPVAGALDVEEMGPSLSGLSADATLKLLNESELMGLKIV